MKSTHTRLGSAQVPEILESGPLAGSDNHGRSLIRNLLQQDSCGRKVSSTSSGHRGGSEFCLLPKMTSRFRRIQAVPSGQASRPDFMEDLRSCWHHIFQHLRKIKVGAFPVFLGKLSPGKLSPGKISMESFPWNFFPGKLSQESFPWKVFPGKF